MYPLTSSTWNQKDMVPSHSLAGRLVLSSPAASRCNCPYSSNCTNRGWLPQCGGRRGASLDDKRGLLWESDSCANEGYPAYLYCLSA